MRPIKSFAMVVALALGLAACGSNEPASTPSAPAASAPGPLYGGGGKAATVKTGETDLGTILTGPDGLTVYAFDGDEEGESYCYDSCASTWPALTVAGEAVAGNGLDSSKLGTIDRTEGTVQVTYGGHPLYYFASDSAPGDTNGQGVSDMWHVVSPEGDTIT